MSDQAPTQNSIPVQQDPAAQQGRKFLVVDIQGDPQMVDRYCGLLNEQLQTSIDFYRAMFGCGRKRNKVPSVRIYERQAE